MNKPERVEAGQCWLLPFRDEVIRVEWLDDARGNGKPMAIHSGGHGETACWFLMRDGTYLGNGENPEPSEWMVEALVEHGHYAQSGDVLHCSRKTTATERVRELLQGYEPGNYFDRAVISLYRILRSLGKW